MPSFRQILPVLLFPLLFTGPAHGADAAGYLGKPDCRIAQLKPEPTRVGVSWSGACIDGYADGPGVLEWFERGKGKRHIEGRLVRGELTGEGKLTYHDGSYTGSFRQGLPHGAGYFEYTNGEGRYEGGVADGLHEGMGMHIAEDRSTYEGEWKAGKRHGRGKAVFALGGSYDGEWREDELHGKGTIVYSSGRTWSGEFLHDRAAGATPMTPTIGEKHDGPVTHGYAPVFLHMRNKRMMGMVTLDTEWEALAPAEKNMVRDAYPALDERDEPPYPRKGMKALYDASTEAYSRFTRYEGDVVLHIVVGADGVPKTARVFRAPHPELGRFVAMAMMVQRFKPALCAGTPCEMIYPVKFNFSLE